MHQLFQKADLLSREIIGAAIEVHRNKGPGLIESIYERCLMRELQLRNIAAVNQRLVRIEYKGLIFDEPLRFDVLVEDCLLLELKSVQEILPVHKAQLLSYMKLLDAWVDHQLSRREPRRWYRADDASKREPVVRQEKIIERPRDIGSFIHPLPGLLRFLCYLLLNYLFARPPSTSAAAFSPTCRSKSARVSRNALFAGSASI
jgi:GxxExxY protein